MVQTIDELFDITVKDDTITLSSRNDFYITDGNGSPSYERTVAFMDLLRGAYSSSAITAVHPISSFRWKTTPVAHSDTKERINASYLQQQEGVEVRTEITAEINVPTGRGEHNHYGLNLTVFVKPNGENNQQLKDTLYRELISNLNSFGLSAEQPRGMYAAEALDNHISC